MRTRFRWERLPALGASLEDLDQPAVEDMAAEVARRRLYDWSAATEPKSILKELNLVQNEQLRNSAIVLFGRAPARLYPQTRVRLIRFTDQEQTESTDNRLLEGHAFALLEQVDRF